MKRRRRLARLVSWLALAAGVGVSSVPAAAQESQTYQATTTENPAVPTDELELLLIPLTRAELEVEAEAWLRLLQARVRQVSEAEIAQASGSGDAADLAALRTGRAAVVERVNLVLNGLEEKGGGVEEHRKYIRAVAGIRLDITDTNAAWATIVGWLKSDKGGMRWLRNIAGFIAIVFAFWVVAAVVGKVTEKALTMGKRLSTLLQDFISKAVRRVVLLIGFVVALSALEVNIGPLLAMIGAAGFVLAFALQDSLGNLASGLMILIYRPFDVGDAVDVGGVSGKVDSMNLVSTTIKTFDNKIVVVPNNKIWGDIITNVTGSAQRRVDMVFGISYDSNLAKAQAILEKVVTEHPLVLADPEPVIRVHELADSSVNFICRPWANTPDYWTVFWDVTRSVKEEFDGAGISIPFPQRDIHVHHVGGDVSPGSPAGPGIPATGE